MVWHRRLEGLINDVGSRVAEWHKGLVLSPKDRAKESAENHRSRVQRQRDLIGATVESSEALAFNIRRALQLPDTDPRKPPKSKTRDGSGGGPIESDLGVIPSLRVTLSGDEINPSPQYETARNVHDSLEGLTRRIAGDSRFWLLCHIRWLECSSLPNPPICLLGEHSNKLRFCNQATPEDDLDNGTRTLLRYTGGLPHIRDAGAFWYDTPLAGAWWRLELCRSAVEVGGGAFDITEAYEVLIRRANWVEWTRWVYRRSGRLAAPTALAGFVIASLLVRDRIVEDPPKPEEMMSNLARRCKPFNLDAMDPHTLADFCFD